MTHADPATGPATGATRIRRREPAALLRAGALTLAGISVAATAFELAGERHWNDLDQLIPWAALVVLLGAIGAVLVPRAAALTLSRVLAAIVLAASLYGIVDHTVANHDAGALDGRYSETWDDLPAAQQWWYAATKTVGPAPTLAPGVLGQAALLVLLAGVGRRERAASRHRG